MANHAVNTYAQHQQNVHPMAIHAANTYAQHQQNVHPMAIHVANTYAQHQQNVPPWMRMNQMNSLAYNAQVQIQHSHMFPFASSFQQDSSGASVGPGPSSLAAHNLDSSSASSVGTRTSSALEIMEVWSDNADTAYDQIYKVMKGAERLMVGMDSEFAVPDD